MPPDQDDDTDIPDPKRRSPRDALHIEPGPLPAISPDGGFAPGAVGAHASIPAATPENFICLNGPCRHYWETESFFESGNPKETWDPKTGLKNPDGTPVRQPRQITRSCIAHAGTVNELNDDSMYDCNLFDPLSPRELRKRLAKRGRFAHLSTPKGT